MSVPIFQQPSSIGQMSLARRLFLFLCGLIESAIWSGTILGWPSLVHILKSHGVFSHLCPDSYQYGSNQTALNSSSSSSYSHSSIMAPDEALPEVYLFGTTPEEGFAEELLIMRAESGCRAQDEVFTLVGTVSFVLYSTPGILVGYALHYLGQAFVRIMSSLMISVGFIMLSFTSKETPSYIWEGAILISIGGGSLRMAYSEFGNLFPKCRNTMMVFISGIYTASSALFMLMQSVMEAGYSWETICQSLAIGSALILATTPFLPRHHIPYTDGDVDCEKQKGDGDEDGDGKEKSSEKPDLTSPGESLGTPLLRSLWSLSMVLVTLWFIGNIYATGMFLISFNSWVNTFSKTQEEAAYYSKLFGYSSLLSIFSTALPGLTIDFLANLLKRGKTGIEAEVACVRAMALPLIVVTTSTILLISCFFFFSSWAVYLGLFCLIIGRPCVYGLSIPFVRARFPADHFNRLLGIQTTLLSIMTAIQYPHFIWMESQYYSAIGVTIGLLGLTILHPLHLLSKTYLYRILGAECEGKSHSRKREDLFHQSQQTNSSAQKCSYQASMTDRVCLSQTWDDAKSLSDP